MNEQDIFSSAGLPAREQVTTWFKIKEKVGNKVSGEFLGAWFKEADAGFNASIGVAIKQTDGSVVGVSLSDTPYMRSRVEPSQIGDMVGIKYEGDKDTGKPQPAKIVKFYNPALEERRKKGEVKETPLQIEEDVRLSETDDVAF